ncbi:hypothetical protein [Streptomyces sp. NPDC060065]|uniref:hypothetical protein n=1 Tax=Streptomyces sp. NPDC060065 TaxID=3347050 RepID=UPI0036804565
MRVPVRRGEGHQQHVAPADKNITHLHVLGGEAFGCRDDRPVEAARRMSEPKAVG